MGIKLSNRCPLCGSLLYRRRRNIFDKTVTLITQKYPYVCAERLCNWRGWLSSQKQDFIKMLQRTEPN